MDYKRALFILLTAVSITSIAGLAGMRPASAERALGGPIISCTTITAPGVYTLTGPITSSGNCMVIRASNVTLNLNKFTLGGKAPAGVGVVIVHGIQNVQVVNGQISGWAIGVQDLGTNTQLEKLTVVNDARRGIVLLGATGSTIMNDKFPGNGAISIFVNTTKGATVNQNSVTGSGKYGIWVRSSTQFTVTGNALSQSGIAGIFVGCTGTGIKNTLTCKASQGGTIGANRIVYSPHLGIAIDRGNGHIHVFNNHVSGSSKFDLFDSNLNCGSDTWSGDVYTKSNQACVK